LARVPDGDDLLRIGDGLALGLGALGLGRYLGGCAVSILSSSVRTHG
jgi:F0F1-type ATP synthase membrane subunit c/vacuolar-type H+-ATPase subunit K